MTHASREAPPFPFASLSPSLALSLSLSKVVYLFFAPFPSVSTIIGHLVSSANA